MEGSRGCNPANIGSSSAATASAGSVPTYRRAVRYIKLFCEEELDANYELEIVDITSRPEMAEEMNVLATPALVKVSPVPAQRICGDLSDRDRLVTELLPQRRPR